MMRQELRTIDSDVEEIKSRYPLTFCPKGAAEEGWHRLEVKLKNRKGEVRARRGYYHRPPVK
jgi:hypothetical protein